MRHENQRRSGERSARRSAAPDDVSSPLGREGHAGRADRRERQELEPFDVVDRDHRPDRLEQARDEVDLDVEVAQAVDETELLLVAVVGEGDDHALHVVLADERGDVVRRAEDRDAVEVGAHALRIGIDEPDQPDPELGMLAELPPDELADVAGAHDQRVLDVALAVARERPRGAAEDGDGHRRDRPEGDDVPHDPVELEDRRGDEAEPGAEGDEEDERPQLVQRRVVSH